jgi:hypothetical protein
MIEKGSSMKYRNSLILFIVYIISLLVIIYFDPLNIVTN